MFYLLIYLSDPDSVGLRVDTDAAQASKVSDRCLIGVGPMVLAIWGYIMCLNFLMCVLNVFSFHQTPVYNHPSPIIPVA